MKNVRLVSLLIMPAFAWSGLAQKISQQGDCPSIYLTFDASQNHRSEDVIFSATKIMDLQIHVVLDPAITGNHTVRLKIFTPDNHLYQELTQPVTTDSFRGGTLRQVSGYPRPLPVKPIAELGIKGIRAQGVTMPLPVAGTSIVSSGLYGNWRIEAYLDEETEPCGNSQTFTLVP